MVNWRAHALLGMVHVPWLVSRGWLEHPPVHQKVAGLISSQGTYLGCRFDLQLGRAQEAVNQCFSQTLISLSLSLSAMKKCPGVRIKKKRNGVCSSYPGRSSQIR